MTKGRLTFCDVLSTSLSFSKGLIDFLRGLEVSEKCVSIVYLGTPMLSLSLSIPLGSC